MSVAHSPETLTRQDEVERILDDLDAFRTAMVTTMSKQGILHARPMMVADREGPVLWFAVHLDDGVADEVRTIHHANIAFQGMLVYGSLSGAATIERDRRRVEENWSDAWAGFFPNGVDDPDIALLRVEVRSGRLWDLRGAKGLTVALRAIGSRVSRSLEGTLPDPGPDRF